MTTSHAIGQARPEAIAAALALPVAEGPVVFIGAPWLLNHPDGQRVIALHSGRPPQ